MAFTPQVILDTFTSGVPQYTGVTSGTSRVIEYPSDNGNLTIWFTSVGTTSGGTLIIEETDLVGSPATWSQIASVSAADFTGGAKKAYHIAAGSGVYLRVRISSAITGGGTVYVTVSGNQ